MLALVAESFRLRTAKTAALRLKLISKLAQSLLNHEALCPIHQLPDLRTVQHGKHARFKTSVES